MVKAFKDPAKESANTDGDVEKAAVHLCEIIKQHSEVMELWKKNLRQQQQPGKESKSKEP